MWCDYSESRRGEAREHSNFVQGDMHRWHRAVDGDKQWELGGGRAAFDMAVELC